MAFKNQYQQSKMDTTRTIGGFLGVGNHTVTIHTVHDLEQTLKVEYRNDFGDKFVDTIFIASTTGANYSKKLTELLSCLPTELMCRIAEEDDYTLMAGSQVRVNIERSEGNYIIRKGVVYGVEGDESGTEYTSYSEAKARLEELGNKAYLRIVEFAPIMEDEPKGVW
jgi:hypothetical protein